MRGFVFAGRLWARKMELSKPVVQDQGKHPTAPSILLLLLLPAFLLVAEVFCMVDPRKVTIRTTPIYCITNDHFQFIAIDLLFTSIIIQ